VLFFSPLFLNDRFYEEVKKQIDASLKWRFLYILTHSIFSRDIIYMAKSNSMEFCGSITDDDSGIGIDDTNSSRLTLIESSSSYSSLLSSSTTIKQRSESTPLIKFASDGIVERIRPSTMKNSENGDFILCQTTRGTYVAYRTAIVPPWITRLVQEIESQQR
jgi:hypothetical protein